MAKHLLFSLAGLILASAIISGCSHHNGGGDNSHGS